MKTSEKDLERIIELGEETELAEFVMFEKLVRYITENNYGYAYLDGDKFLVAVDGGKVITNPEVSFYSFIEHYALNPVKQLFRVLIRKEFNICPTTYIFFTNIEFEHWLDEDSLIDKLLKAHPHYNMLYISKNEISDEAIEESNNKRHYIFASEVSEEVEEREYDVVQKHFVNRAGFYTYTIIKYTDLLEVFDDDRQPYIPIILPKNNPYREHPHFKGKEIPVILKGMKDPESTDSGIYFVSEYGSNCEAYLYKQITFDEFFDLETELDLLNVFEALRPYRLPVDDGEEVLEEAYTDEAHTEKDYQALFWYANEDKDFSYVPKLDMFKKRKSNSEEVFEDRMVADIYTVIPVRYDSFEELEKYQSFDNNFVVNNIATGLNFQENFEFGNESKNVRKFHDRMHTFDLGTLNVLITEEPHYNYYKKAPLEIIYDKTVPVRLMLIVDKDTHTAVLMLVNLGVKYHPTKYLDEVSRNNLIFVPTEEDKKYDFDVNHVITQTFEDESGSETVTYEYMSLYKYIRDKFSIKPVSIPRSLILSPFLHDDDESDPNITKQYKEIKASLLYGKTLYTDAEELGKLIDKNLDHMFKTEFGDAVYDYAVINQSKIAVLQYDRTYKDYIVERIDFAVVSLFYLVLIQLEDSAINIAGNSYSEFVDKIEIGSKKKVSYDAIFETIDAIEEEYTRTIDFWNVQGNYHTTNIAYQSMRNAFRIKDSIDRLNRNSAQIKRIYEAKQANREERNDKFQAIFMLVFSLTSVYEAIIAIADREDLSLFANIIKFVTTALNNLTYIGFALIIVAVRIIMEVIKEYRKNKFSDDYLSNKKNKL